MKDLRTIFDVANSRAELYAIETVGEDVMIYPCGFAWVLLCSKEGNRDPLGKELEAMNLFSWDPHEGNYYYWINDHNQSWNHKVAHAKKLAEELTDALGVEFIYKSKLD